MAIDANLDCVKKKCTGEKLNGLNIDCNRCDKKWFLECLINENEINVLMNTIGLIETKQDESSGQTKTVTNVTERKKTILNTIIGKESPIEYVCLTCKKLYGSTRNKIKNMEAALIKMNEKIKSTEKKTDALQKQIEQKQTEVDDSQRTINELTKQIEQKDKIIEQNETKLAAMIAKNNDYDDDESDSESENSNDGNGQKHMKKMKQMIQHTVTKQMKIETEKIERIIKETISEQRERNTFKKRRNVRFNDNISMDDMDRNEYENIEQSERNIQFDAQLIPTKQINNENKLYEIYVSKFACNIPTEFIEQHITCNTNYSTHTFTIEEIKSNNNSGRTPNYKAFKITTLKRDIYNDIMNIWEPHYKARDFIPTKIEGGQTATNTYYEHTTNTHDRTPNRTYNMRSNDTGHNTYRQNKQFTPKRNMSYSRNEQNGTKTNNGFERNVTPERHNYNTERRQMSRQYNRQSEQQQQKQNIQQMNTLSNFLDMNTQSQQYQQGAGNRYRQGVNSQHQQGRVQYETRSQQHNPFR